MLKKIALIMILYTSLAISEGAAMDHCNMAGLL